MALRNKIAPICVILLSCVLGLAETDASSEREEAMAELNALFVDILPWLAQTYDPVSGGFYESIGLKEGKEPKAYGPDIQSTFFAIIILDNAGLVDTMPPEVKEKMIGYFHSRQDPETGYFIDPDFPDMWENQRVLGRALSFSIGSLRILGSEPLYPLPGQPRPKTTAKTPSAPASKAQPAAPAASSSNTGKTTAPKPTAPKPTAPKANNVYIVPTEAEVSQIDLSRVPPHLVSVEAFRQWLDDRPWHFSWTALDNLSSQKQLIKGLPPQLRDPLIDEAMRYVGERQEPDTGLIGGGNPEVRISGAFKFVRFCVDTGRPVPRAEEMRDSLIAWFKSEPEIDKIFFIRNACDMMNDLSKQTGQQVTDEQLVEITRFSTKQLKHFRQDDGAFLSRTSGSYVNPNDLYLGSKAIPAKAGFQSEMNGTSNAHRVWKTIYWIAGQERPDMTMEDFWEVVARQDFDNTPEPVAAESNTYIVP